MMTSHDKRRAIISRADDGVLMADGLDEAIVGIGQRCGQPNVVVYSIPKAIQCLVAQGMTHEEAEECLEFNSIGAWVGDGTPVWLTPIDDIETIDTIPVPFVLSKIST